MIRMVESQTADQKIAKGLTQVKEVISVKILRTPNAVLFPKDDLIIANY